jgi:5-methylcytosine-specific restriction protein A
VPFDHGLHIGACLKNDQIGSIFGGSSQGGMRFSVKNRTLVLIAYHTKSLYEDKWEDDILHYTGMGTQGDQRLDFRFNRTLHESKTNGVEVFLFEGFQPKEYIFRGQVELCCEPYQSKQRDINGCLRSVWIFPIKVMGAIPISFELIEKYHKKNVRQIRKLSDMELEKRINEPNCRGGKREVVTTVFQRDAGVVEYVKRKAKGVCQLCERSAPFTDEEGKPYLEAHHIEWLSRGGEDTISNTVALCPNCHRKMHVLDCKKDKDILKTKVFAYLDSTSPHIIELYEYIIKNSD